MRAVKYWHNTQNFNAIFSRIKLKNFMRCDIMHNEIILYCAAYRKNGGLRRRQMRAQNLKNGRYYG